METLPETGIGINIKYTLLPILKTMPADFFMKKAG